MSPNTDLLFPAALNVSDHRTHAACLFFSYLPASAAGTSWAPAATTYPAPALPRASTTLLPHRKEALNPSLTDSGPHCFTCALPLLGLIGMVIWCLSDYISLVYESCALDSNKQPNNEQVALNSVCLSRSASLLFILFIVVITVLLLDMAILISLYSHLHTTATKTFGRATCLHIYISCQAHRICQSGLAVAISGHLYLRKSSPVCTHHLHAMHAGSQ